MKYLALAAAMALQLSFALPAAACEYPNKDVKILIAAPPVIPDATLKKHPHDTTTLVKVDVNGSGKVVNTRIASSSGDPVIDAAAVKAARESTYAPATRNCKGVMGSYLFNVTVGKP